MGRSKPDERIGRLFRHPSGQDELFDKSYEEELEAQRAEPVECLGLTFRNDEARRTHYLSRLREGLEELHAKLGAVPYTGLDDAVARMAAIEHWPMGEEAELRRLAERMRHADLSKDLLQRWKDEAGFPHGDIENILNLSDPPWHTACPNPFLGAFVDAAGKPDDPDEPYSGKPFAVDVSEGKKHSVYRAHGYAGLHNQPPDPPVMVHHVPRFLARRIEQASDGKVALIVVDGLALDQWIVLRNVLADQRPCLRFREGAVFAWVPTITSVSRQAIFAGKPPRYFPASILGTDREPSSWKQFWENQGVPSRVVDYAKGLGDGPLDKVGEILSRTDIRALGLVVDKVDKIMHGMELGTAGMHNQVRQWAGEGFMAGLLDLLLGDGFSVFLTSDHGNIEAVGGGRPSEGVVADVRGERARIYPDTVLRSRIQEQFTDAVESPAIGLPEDCMALLAPARTAFVRTGERIVGHGGASLEEVVVPWIEIERTAS